MSINSHIQWCEATWNCVLGCSKISPGCKHCYAINHVHRLAGNPNPKIKAANQGLTVIQGGETNWTGKVRLIPERLDIPVRTRKPTTWFVNSLSDLFHEELPDESIDMVFGAMFAAEYRGHRFQILTKRAERMRSYFAHRSMFGWPQWFDFPSGDFRLNQSVRTMRLQEFDRQIWLGVSVESRDYLSRIDHLRQTPAAVRFLSLEPLLEDLGPLDLTGIHWVICGGESGKGARPMHPSWVRSIREQCIAANVPFFFKQWGGFRPVGCADRGSADCDYDAVATANIARTIRLWPDATIDDGDEEREVGGAWYMEPVAKKKAGRLLDGRTWDQMPEQAGGVR